MHLEVSLRHNTDSFYVVTDGERIIIGLEEIELEDDDGGFIAML